MRSFVSKLHRKKNKRVSSSSESWKSIKAMLQQQTKKVLQRKTTIEIKQDEMKLLQDRLFAIPPNLDIAKQHAQAQQMRYYGSEVDIINGSCFCCNRVLPKHSRAIGLWEKGENLIKYGDGYWLLFQFLKFIITIFVLMFIIQGVFLYIWSVILYSIGKKKDINFVSMLSVDGIMDDDGNIINELEFLYNLIFMLTNLALMISLWVFWVKQEKYNNYLDEQTKTDADFAVMFKGLAQDFTSKQLKTQLIDIGIKEENIIYVNKCFKIDHIMNLKKKQFKWLHKKMYLQVFRKKMAERGHEDLSELYPPRSILRWPPCAKYPSLEEINENLEQIQNELLDEHNQKVSYWGTSIVVFKTEKDAENVINHYYYKKWETKFKRFCALKLKCCKKHYKIKSDILINGKLVSVRRCPEPENIMWENLAINTKKRLWAISLIYFVGFLIVFPTIWFVIYLYQK